VLLLRMPALNARRSARGCGGPRAPRRGARESPGCSATRSRRIVAVPVARKACAIHSASSVSLNSSKLEDQLQPVDKKDPEPGQLCLN